MIPARPDPAEERLRAALWESDTREVHIGRGSLERTPDVFRRLFGPQTALIVADVNTFAAAGRIVLALLDRAGVKLAEPLVFSDTDVLAEQRFVERVEERLTRADAIPIAVGSGTINDLSKLAAHRSQRPYMAVATAVSMDGYAAFAASITDRGSKQTFSCPPPRAVIADLDVLCAAPPELNAAGYADLLAKTTAGADWLLADALGVEAIDPAAWSLVQDNLREWIAAPEGIARGDERALGALMRGLVMSGLAMQRSRSSRPASGAEHQFSHLWDMQGHRHLGRPPLHGAKVGIGTLACTLLYEELLAEPLEDLDADDACRRWPEPEALIRQVRGNHALPALQAVAEQETRAKYLDRGAARELLIRLKKVWPALRPRLQAQLLPSADVRRRLRAAGAPSTPEAIGIDLPRLRRSYLEAWQIRRRFTVLDLAALTGLLPACLDRMFAPGGVWDVAQ